MTGPSGDPESEHPRFSVIVPVFNEAENIVPFCRQAREHLPAGGEVLICYDFEEDTTLPALAAIHPDSLPEGLRLVRNTLGPGVRYAIEAGMRNAASPIVVVAMADLCDDLTLVGPLVDRARSGADVVCASRYMSGGRQIGGPWLKGTLSRLAGLSLHAFVGVPVHDPTNSFKAYRRSFLDRTPLQSTAGFTLALELTLKAHFGGGRVEELPVVWRDRIDGESRFRLLKWLPGYLRWYLAAFYWRFVDSPRTTRSSAEPQA